MFKGKLGLKKPKGDLIIVLELELVWSLSKPMLTKHVLDGGLIFFKEASLPIT